MRRRAWIVLLPVLLFACTEFNGLSFTSPVDGGARDGGAQAALDASSDATPDATPGDAGSCAGAHLYEHEGHCYRFSETKAVWSSAESDCVAWGGHLVSIGSAEEHAFVVGVEDAELPALDAGNGAGAWIGLNDVAIEGTFVWTSGEPVIFTAWAPGQPDGSLPNKDCVFQYTSLLTGNWDDFQCDLAAPYMCEK